MSTQERKLTAACYIAPHGRVDDIPDVDAYPDDVDYILDNGFRLTLEDMNGKFIAYLMFGTEGHQETIIFRRKDEECRDTIKRLVEETKELIKETQND